MSQYIREAFKRFNLLEDAEDFPLTPDGIASLGDALEADEDTDNIVNVIDADAESEEELKQSYVGKVICDCNVCHSNIFFDKEDIVIDEDGVVNVEDECPYCMSNDGYTIVGEIKEWSPEVETEIENAGEEPAEEVTEEEVDTEFTEGLKARRRKKIDEAALKRIRAKRLMESKRKKLSEDITLEPDAEVEVPEIVEVDTVAVEPVIEEPAIEGPAIEGPVIEEPAVVEEPVEDAPTVKLVHANENDIIEDAATGAKWVLTGGEMVPCIEECVQNECMQTEGLKLDGVKELRGTPGLKRRPDKLGVNSLRGLGNSEISGTTITESDESHVNESIENVTIDTEDETMTMTTKEDGGVVVETSPKMDELPVEDVMMDEPMAEVGDEVIAPLSDETEAEITGETEEEPFADDLFGDEIPEEGDEEVPEEGDEEEEDIDIEGFDDEMFDGLGESYLRRCYENVNGYKTVGASVNENKLTLNGVITFKSGAQKKTNFVFEAKEKAKGKYIFEGYNPQITKGKNAFRLTCSIKNKNVYPTALKYNYTSKNALNESVKLSGTVKAKRK